MARARRIPCDDEAIDGGEGRRADYLIENAWARFVIRDAGAPLSLLEGGGGTLIDAAPPGGQDALVELVPLVGMGWLSQTSVELEQGPNGAAIHVTGVPTPITFLEGFGAAEPPAETVTIHYTLGPDDFALGIQGADGFWLMPNAGAELAGSTLRREGVMVGIDGRATDLGGGVLFEGGERFAAGEPSEVMAALWPGGVSVEGVTAGQGVEILAGSEPVGWLPVDQDGGFAGFAPVGATGLRALATGYGAGPVQDLSAGGDLPLGAEGWLGVRVVDRQGQALPALATAIDSHGRMTQHPVEPPGSWLGLGAGTWDIEVDAGPLYPRAHRSLARLQGRVELEVVVDGPGPPAGWALAELEVETWPSRYSRIPAAQALARVAARGVAYAVVGAPDEVAVAELEQPWDGGLRTDDASWAVSPEQGTVLAWPVSSNRRKPAHGAVAWKDLVAEDILRVAAGNQSQHRLLAVDVPWLEAAGPAMEWEPRPDMVRLEGLHQLDVLLELYDAWVDLTPTGPLTWVRLGHNASFPAVEVQSGLLEGRTVAGTGPFLALEVDGVESGGLCTGRQPRTVWLEVLAPRDRALAGAALVVDGEIFEQWDLSGGTEPSRLAVRRVVPSGRYVLALAWGPQDLPAPEWAVTAPVWTGRP